jgi:protein O-mannosyl-transferase
VTVPPEQPTASAKGWAVAALLLLVSLFHGPSLANGFVYDDAWTVVSNPTLRNPRNLLRLVGPELARAGAPDAGRPTLVATEIVDHALWGLQPRGYHFQNLLWHGAVVVLFFLGFARLHGSLAVPLAAAALVAIHPLNVEAVAAINYREDLLAAFFLLLALAAVEGARATAPDGSWIRGAAGRGGAFVAALLACGAKENAYLAGPLLLVCDACRPHAVRGKSRWLDPLLLAAAAALVFAWRWWAVGAPGAVSRTAEHGHAHEGSSRLGQGIVAFFQGLLQFLWPAGLSPEYTPAAAGPPTLALAGLALALVVGAAAGLRRRAPWPAAGMLWGIVAYLPNLGLWELTNLRADRYFYLPSLGLAVVVASGLAAIAARLPRLRRLTIFEVPVLALLATAGLLVLGLRSLRQGRIWRTDLTLFAAATAAAPESQRAWLGLAGARLRAGHMLPALSASQRALALGDDFHARQMHGLVLAGQGDLAGARAQLGRALAGGPPPHHRAQILNNLGYVEAKLGRTEEALGRFALARKLDPDFDRPWLNAARAHVERRELDRARDLLQELLARVPESIDGWKQLGVVRERTGQLALARAAYQRARALSPDDPDAAKALERLDREQPDRR